MASITQGKSLSVLRSTFMASLGWITPRVSGSKFLVAGASSVNPRILASGKCERSSTSKRMSAARCFKLQVSCFREPLYLMPILH